MDRHRQQPSNPLKRPRQRDNTHSDPEAIRARLAHHVPIPKTYGSSHSYKDPINHSQPLQAPSVYNGSGSDDESSVPLEPHWERRSKQALMTTIDWRGHLCQFLKIDSESTDHTILKGLDLAAEKLEEAEQLTDVEIAEHYLAPRYQIIHRIDCAVDGQVHMYQEQLFVVSSGSQGSHLRGTSEPIHNFELYLERNKDISFITYKDYRCCTGHFPGNCGNDKAWDIDPSTMLIGESVSIISPILSSAMRELTDNAMNGIAHPDFGKQRPEFVSPYLWWFFRRQEIAKSEGILNGLAAEHVHVFKQYLQDHSYETWSVVDSLLQEGSITSQLIDYLFEPETILISNSKHEKLGQQQAYKATSFLTRGAQVAQHPDEFRRYIYCVHWTFDGNFKLVDKSLVIDELPSRDEPFPIQNLPFYPIKYAEHGLENTIRARGDMFWKCRIRNYVCYSGPSNDGIQSNLDPRFMVDISTFKQMHPSTDAKQDSLFASPLELTFEELTQEEPPRGDSFVLCLPKTIPGFDMNKKEWTSLDVSRITPVRWNTEAFDSLVIDETTKELIKALVTNQIDAEKGTDMMSGKGNGLFILLHGGPGTGKTLTAESVAEVSEKPLYRVTCGDIGTKAEEVEKYLQVVMLLGKTWGCVVLLDEADVFLEKRKVSDLQRNALVSVFLRVLEYYDGILILTSNRVGFFDEAFKSRIQLTLRYKALDKSQRLQIWRNFIKRLKSLQENSQDSNPSIHGVVDTGIDAEQVESKLDQLAEAELNGREIRNAISTARQLAMFRKKRMGYEHLRVVLEEARKFEDYLLELREGFSPDEISKIEGAMFG